MTCQLLTGDAETVLRTLPAGSVQCCITSPPYFGLRDYGCDGQIGLEDTPEAYIARLVAVFRGVRRVLRDDGTLWVNIGDSYANDGKWGGHTGGKHAAALHCSPIGRNKRYTGLKPKDLIGIPWMLAFALRADAWYLRSDIIWAKPAPMPESVTDRPTRSHEYLFLLSKRERYYYDSAAIAEDAIKGDAGAGSRNYRPGIEIGRIKAGQSDLDRATRNKRDVWTINTAQFPGAHYAVMPPKLVEPCILAGTSPQACEHCGAPWARVVERIEGEPASFKNSSFVSGKTGVNGNGRVSTASRTTAVATGWQPTCKHEQEGTGRCTVLDPFSGSGTVGLVACSHNRHYIGIDLDPKNIPLARQRIGPMLLEAVS